MLVILYYISNKKFKYNFLNLNYKKIRYILFYLYNNYFSYFTVLIMKNNSIFLILKNSNFLNLFTFLKYNLVLNFMQLLDIVIVDKLEMTLEKGKRFNFIYVLLSLNNNFRIFISGFLALFEALPSVCSLYMSADWLEREIWDMFGIFFVNHPNLRRILTDYGFVGFPLRKDFPLSGYVEIRYDELSKSIVLEPLELTQEFRFFKLENTWIKNVN